MWVEVGVKRHRYSASEAIWGLEYMCVGVVLGARLWEVVCVCVGGLYGTGRGGAVEWGAPVCACVAYVRRRVV